ncbi:MAG: DUF4124 domain-containing protein [Aromatoleum sp.]|jgi:hypothetical protein|uniref:DUF4124 domain-containing protein n=1 Tax=Aromatoleum sp. TaxID=2307007 RepID=UPI0028941198|nr:DUF4124 domain-containing protein [Aromatoleum sp.]MDT3670908.1 DUF4124 domain-containing protein [Aromatoleum sp.]
MIDKRLLPALLALVFAPLAHASVYKCIDANGSVTYTNDRTLGRGCKELSTDQPVSTVPVPPVRAPAKATATPSDFPRVAPEAQRARDDTRRQVLEKELAAEQSALDAALAKLDEEEKRDAPEDRNIRRQRADGTSFSSLNPAKKAERLEPFRDRVELHQRNVEALKKEIGALR